MSADFCLEAELQVDHVGDVIGVRFSQEEEVALFIPNSGDVLLCLASHWQSVHKEGSLPVLDLRSTLQGLGARLE